jgi:hypothetical protein
MQAQKEETKMLTLRVRHLAIMLLVFVALFVLSAGGSDPAHAALGNRGIPVRCFAPGAGVAAGGSAFMTCYAADGTPFSGNQRVPTGYFLLVTDVIVTPRAGSTAAGVTEVSVFDAYGTASRQSQFYLRSTTTGSYGYTFAAPYLVLAPDHRLEIVAAAINAFSVDVRATGLLVYNVSYIPVVIGE